jgi:pyruvate formate lyase activating enzyme
MTKAFIEESVKHCHVELTTLIVPPHNDDPRDMEREAQWISSLDPKIPLHITRYFPMWKDKDPMTPIKTIHELSAIARKYLSSVYEGNI